MDYESSYKPLATFFNKVHVIWETNIKIYTKINAFNIKNTSKHFNFLILNIFAS